jgi:hypothetical protein
MLYFILGVFEYYTIKSLTVSIISSFVFAYSFKHLFKFINILITPTTPIDGLKDGKVEIKGVVLKEKIPDLSVYNDSNKDNINNKNNINDKNNINNKHYYYSENLLATDEVYHKEIQEIFIKGWKEKKIITQGIPFYVCEKNYKDNKVLVLPSGADFEFKDEKIVPFSETQRSKHYSIKDGAPIYVLGEYSEYKSYISQKDSFFISTKKEITLLLQHGFKGFGSLLLMLSLIGGLLFLANKKYQEKWEGRVISKSSYVSGSGKNQTTHYVVKLNIGSKEITRSRWNNVREGVYIIKKREEFFIEILDNIENNK